MFTRNVAPTSPKPKGARIGTPGLTFIGPDAIVHGDLATESQLHVDGRIQGNVRCDQLIQGPEGMVAGNIEATEARLAGTVEGAVSGGTLIIEASARIMGDVAYETISIEAGAQIDGRLARRTVLELGGADAPALIATPVSFSPAKPGEGADADALFALADAASGPRHDTPAE